MARVVSSRECERGGRRVPATEDFGVGRTGKAPAPAPPSMVRAISVKTPDVEVESQESMSDLREIAPGLPQRQMHLYLMVVMPVKGQLRQRVELASRKIEIDEEDRD